MYSRSSGAASDSFRELRSHVACIQPARQKYIATRSLEVYSVKRLQGMHLRGKLKRAKREGFLTIFRVREGIRDAAPILGNSQTSVPLRHFSRHAAA